MPQAFNQNDAPVPRTSSPTSSPTLSPTAYGMPPGWGGQSYADYTGDIDFGTGSNDLLAGPGTTPKPPVKPTTTPTTTPKPTVKPTTTPTGNSGGGGMSGVYHTNVPVPNDLSGLVTYSQYNSPDGGITNGHPATLANDSGALTHLIDAEAITGSLTGTTRAAQKTLGNALRADMSGGGINAGRLGGQRIKVE